MNLTIAIPRGGRYFEGHFPGRPILPGVTELVLALRALGRATNRSLDLCALPYARLRAPVLPGDRLDLHAREISADRFRLDLKRDQATVADAEVVLGEAPPLDASESMSVVGAPCLRPATNTNEAPAALDDLLPHRPPMRLVAGVLAESADGLACSAAVPMRCALVENGSAPALACVEAAAQAAALWEAGRRRRDSAGARPRLGYLVALRDLQFGAESIRADEVFRVAIRLEALALPATRYCIEAACGERLLVRGRIVTVLTNESIG